MCAGLLSVIPNYAALTETACDFAFMYEWSSNPQKHVELFTSVLNHAMDCFRLPFYQNVLKMQRSYYQYFYGWDLRAAQWTAMLTKMLENK